ncbi:MAG TPA: BamA/TamA family outer membrane protein [Polyangiaceae bacterium]|nr:BamA/TamA family outer membrane protein [Polyangiaceae bacterium]
MLAQRSSNWSRLWLLAIGLAFANAACRPLPRELLVDSVSVRGLARNDSKKLRAGLSTVGTPLLFGFIPRVLEYSTYDANVLARDLQRVERYLRARGYYEAKVLAAQVIHTGPHSVRVELTVYEGEPVRVARIDPGLSRLPFEVMGEANRARHMADGDILDEAEFDADKARIERVLREAGYAFAKVEAKVTVDVAAHTAHMTYAVDAGPRAHYGAVTIVGLQQIPEGPVRDNLSLREGDVYNEAELEDAQRALISLGVFSNVDVHADRSHPEQSAVPIQVRVRESALRTLRLGGGAHFDVLRLSARLETGWEHKNFLGGMRYFSVDARPGLTFFPTRIDHLVPWTRYLPENRVGVELRQPSFLEGRTTGALSAQYNVYPLLYPLPDDVNPEDEPIIGYQEVKASARVQRAFFGHHLDVVPSYNWQANFPFNYQGDRASLLDSVRVSFPELVTTLSFVDDPLQPHLGLSLSNSLQVAGHGFGGSVDDVRVAPEFKFYLPVEKGVFAGRLSTGFLFPSGYGDAAYQAATAMDSDDQVKARTADQQKLLFRAFYSGGPSSNRGYPYRTVGPHGPVGFLVPNGIACLPNDTRSACVRPLGGLTLWEASLEARIPFPIDAPLWGVLFVDASDLTSQVGRIRLNVPHLSPGFGLRYMTPVGPIRLDVGWRVPGAQALGKRELPEDEGRPGSDLFGFFPGAIHLAIGEAF